MVPVFIAHYLPHGIIGLIVVALIAAWMSAYSSALNSLTAVTMEDFIGRKFRVPPEKYVPLSKLIALGWGLFTLGFGFFTGKIAATAIEAINKIGSVFYGPIIGMFLLAALGRRIKPLGANLGVVLGVAVNLVLWLCFKNVFWFWWNAIGGVTTLAVGLGWSAVTGVPIGRDETTQPAGVPAAKKEILILLTYFAAIVTFCVLLPRMIR
jgi:Na+/proline symporter